MLALRSLVVLFLTTVSALGADVKMHVIPKPMQVEQTGRTATLKRSSAS